VVRRIFETPERYLELRDRFADEWRAQQLSPEGRAILGELRLAESGTGASVWRSLLESETFRALLAGEPLAGEPIAGEPIAGQPLAGAPPAEEPPTEEPLAQAA